MFLNRALLNWQLALLDYNSANATVLQEFAPIITSGAIFPAQV